MPVKYNMYLGVSEEEVQQFEQLWNRLSFHLDPFPTLIHQERDSYAAVFNSWIRYMKLGQSLVIKPNRMFIHGVVHTIAEKIHKYIPSIILNRILSCKQDPDFIFLYSYFNTKSVLIELEDYLLKNSEFIDYITFEYYYIEDAEVDNGSGVYLLVKDIIYGFVNQHLNENRIKTFHYSAMEETRSIYTYFKSLDTVESEN